MKTKGLILLLLLFCTGQMFAAPCADVNSDGVINIVDALMIAQYCVGLNPAGFDQGAADVNGDSVINIVDALQTAGYYVKIITVLQGCAGPTATPVPTWPSDPKALVKAGNPGNSKLVAYADNELGNNPTIGLVGTGTARTINGPIVVPPGVTYDGKGEILTASSSMGDGSQNENQQPYFVLCPGANVKNVTIGKPGTEGIHMMGYNKLENIKWIDVGEDAASVRSYFPGGIIYMDGVVGSNAADKLFQINAPCLVIIKNARADGIGKFIRQNESVPMDIVLENVTCTGVKTGVVVANTSNCRYMVKNVTDKHVGGTRIPWVDGASEWDGVTRWDGPGSKWPK